MPYHTPDAKSELAFKRLFETYSDQELAGLQILQRGSVEQKQTESISIICDKATPEGTDWENFTGNYDCELTFTLSTHYKENDITVHDNYLGVVCDLIFDNDLKTTLNEVMLEEQFTAFTWTPGERTNRIEGSMFVSEQKGVLYMAPSKV